MKYANSKVHVILILGTGLIFPLQMTFADFNYYGYSATASHKMQNMVQNKSDWQQLELSEGQTRSKVEHALVNYLLGHTIDQYLDLGTGTDDVVSNKAVKKLKLRLNEHHIVLLYQVNF